MKKTRHRKIVEIIEKRDVETQEELAGYLKEAGFAVTQATVSRDIRALKMTKVAGSNGKSRYAILEEHTPDVLSDKYSRVLKDAVIAMNIGQNIVVVKTIPGMAMAAAAALDAMKWSEILGCIAGDDTIFILLRSEEQAAFFAKQYAVWMQTEEGETIC